MAQIKISVKGKLEMTLTRNYNSLSVFTANKDDVGFNESGNPFYDYSLNSPCGSWVGDKIKILSLPNKGRLYYNSTPLSTPTYANVTVGQEIMVRDLIDYKVLRFSAEGSADGQYTESYLTNFTFERYCVSTAQNITVKVNLNMIDDKILTSSIVVSDLVKSGSGITFKVTVSGADFIGYACGIATNSSVNSRAKIVNLDFLTANLTIPPQEELGFVQRASESITIPIGTYTGKRIIVSTTGVPDYETISVYYALGFSLDTTYENSIAHAEGFYYVEGIE